MIDSLPELMHWFHLKPWDLDRMTIRELNVLGSRLNELPPVGGSIGYRIGPEP